MTSPEVRDLIPTDHPPDLAIRKDCAASGHWPPRVYNPLWPGSFCRCGARIYPGDVAACDCKAHQEQREPTHDQPA